MKSIKEGALGEDVQGCKPAIEREKDFSQDAFLQGLHSLLMRVNANPEETEELVKDFKKTEAAREMLDETD